MPPSSTSPLRTILLSGSTALVVTGSVLAGHDLLTQPPAPTPVTTTRAIPAVSEARATPITDVVERTEPAVVSVTISRDVQMGRRQRETQRLAIGGGTAFFISPDGLLMTNKHVVDDPKATYTVFLNDGRELEAKVLDRDPTTDIALLQVEGKDFPYLTLSDSDRLQLGQPVIAIGNALGEFRNTVSVGVVAGLSRSIEAGAGGGEVERLSRIIQTDAAINPGNSGGPLLDTEGNVVGMNTAVATDAQNIGFALPASDLRIVLESYQQHGRIVRPYIGIRYIDVTPELAKEEKLDADHGVLITSGTNEPAVLPGSPAAKAGLEDGDIILSINSEELSDDTSLADIIQRKKPGEKVTLHVSHGGREKDVVVQLDEWKTTGRTE